MKHELGNTPADKGYQPSGISKAAEDAAQQFYDDNSICCSESLIKEIFVAGYEQAEHDFGWISIKDRLPQKEGWYFVCSDDMGIPQALGISYRDTIIDKWLDVEGEEDTGIDFWMQIPDLLSAKVR